jgi:hypothetical protein
LNNPTQEPTPIIKICVGMLAIAVTRKIWKKKKHCLITFTIFTRQLISSMSLPPEKRRDLTPIP